MAQTPGTEPDPTTDPGTEPDPTTDPGTEPDPATDPGTEPDPTTDPGTEPGPATSTPAPRRRATTPAPSRRATSAPSRRTTSAPSGRTTPAPRRRTAKKETAPVLADRGDAWCVVGAGPHGMSALKALLQNGIEADGFERESDVGGNWNFGAENSRVYESTHLISSKPFTQFPDFPMPDSYPDYPSHRQVQVYFGRYADHFGLRERIRFSHDVVRATPVEEGRAWDVTVADRVGGRETTYRYAGLVVANGHNWSPKVPAYPGLDSFRGEVLHSADYKGADVLRGKRVLVVGAGNTGCDVAVESAQNAAHTWHSTRRGYYYNPKYALGRPSDQVADRLLALRIPLGVRRALFGATLKVTVGDLTKFGLKRPDHKFFETHPIVNQQLVYYVGHGDITPVDDVDHLDETGVVLTDGSRVDVDLVVLCTGYLVRFPFLDPQWLGWRDDHPHLGLQMFPPVYDNLAIAGLIQPDSGQWTLAHWQGILVARVAEVLRTRPALAREFLARAAAQADRRYSAGAHYKDSTRHYYEVAHQDYLHALQDAIRELEVDG